MNRSSAFITILGIGLIAFFVGRATSPGTGSNAFDASVPGGSLEERIVEILISSPNLARTRAYTDLLVKLDAEGLRDLASTVKNLPYPPMKGTEQGMLFSRWAELDPNAAFLEALAWEADGMGRNAAMAVLWTWGEADPHAGVFALESLRLGNDSKLRDVLASSLAEGWARSDDLEGVSKFMATLPETWSGEKVARDLIERLRRQNGDEMVLEWATGLSGKDTGERRLKHVVYRKIALVMGAEDPAHIAAWLEPEIEGRHAQGAASILARTWAKIDEQAALAWARSLPEGTGRKWSVELAFQQWYDRDAEAAAAWVLEEDNASGSLDPALALVMRRLVPKGGPDAWQPYLDRFSGENPDGRQRAIFSAATHWARKSPEEALEWAKTGELSDRNRERITRTALNAMGKPARGAL
jgi:hypothetical protein